MALNIKQVAYYNITIKDHASEGSKLLSVIAAAGISLLAYKSVSLEPMCTRFTLFPNDSIKLIDVARISDLTIDGPHSAILMKEEEQDESGDLASIFEKLSNANIQVNESIGIADINHGYGVVLYLSQNDIEKAIVALKQ
jgi:hypothetical protein